MDGVAKDAAAPVGGAAGSAVMSSANRRRRSRTVRFEIPPETDIGFFAPGEHLGMLSDMLGVFGSLRQNEARVQLSGTKWP